MACRFEAKNVLLVLGEYIWQREVIPPAEQWATGVAERPDARRVRRRPRPGDRPGTGAVPPLAPERRGRAWRGSSTTSPTRRSRRTWISRTSSWRGSRPALVERLRGQGRPRPYLRLQRQGPRRLAPRPGRGRLPALPRAIKGLGLDDATVSIELEYSPEPDRIVDWVREAYESTAALMRGGGPAGMRRRSGRDLPGARPDRGADGRAGLAGGGDRLVERIQAAREPSRRADGGRAGVAPRSGHSGWRPRRSGSCWRPSARAAGRAAAGLGALPDRRSGAAALAGDAGAGGVRADAAARDGLARGVRQRGAGAGARIEPWLVGRSRAAFIHALAALAVDRLARGRRITRGRAGAGGGGACWTCRPGGVSYASRSGGAWGAIAGAALAVAVLTAGDMTVTDSCSRSAPMPRRPTSSSASARARARRRRWRCRRWWSSAC